MTRKRVQLHFAKPSRVRPEFKDECDINRIVRNYSRTGVLPQIQKVAGQYADVSSIMSFEDAYNFTQNALSSFMELPAEIREAFDNNPGKFLAAAEDPQQRKFIEMGLVAPSDASKGSPPPSTKATPKTPSKGAPAPSENAPTE